MKGMNPEEDKEFDEGVLGAIDAGLEMQAKPAEPIEPAPETDQDPDSPPIPEIDLEKELAEKKESDPDTKPDEDPKAEDKKPEDKKTEDHAAGESEDGKGTPVPEKEDDPAAPKPDEDQKPEDAKPSDEFGDLEEDAKPATKERFATMKTRFDEVSTELGRVTEQNTAWMDTIQRTGASPNQLGASLAYLEDINLGTPESLERAYQTMQGELDALAKALGKESPGFDPLDAHTDLKTKVDEGYLDRADALELAASRARTNFADNNNNPKHVMQSSQEDGTAALSALGTRLRAGDPEYSAKLTQINQIVEDVVTSGADPSTWANLVEKSYNRIQLPKAEPKPKPKATPNPIRPGASGKSGDFSKEPGSILEAIDLSLGRGY